MRTLRFIEVSNDSDKSFRSYVATSNDRRQKVKSVLPSTNTVCDNSRRHCDIVVTADVEINHNIDCDTNDMPNTHDVDRANDTTNLNGNEQPCIRSNSCDIVDPSDTTTIITTTTTTTNESSDTILTATTNANQSNTNTTTTATANTTIDTHDDETDETCALSLLEYCNDSGVRYHSIQPSRLATKPPSLTRWKSCLEPELDKGSQNPLCIRPTAIDYYLRSIDDLRLPEGKRRRTPAGHRFPCFRCNHLDCSQWHLSKGDSGQNDQEKTRSETMLDRLLRRVKKFELFSWRKSKANPKSKHRGIN